MPKGMEAAGAFVPRSLVTIVGELDTFNKTLAPGIPLPTGIVGHSCVVSQESGRVLLSDGMCTGTRTLHIF